MVKIRINDLARELEVKSKVILEALTAIGFTEPKTHSSAVDEDVAARVRRHLHGEAAEPEATPAPLMRDDAPAPRAAAPPA
ncbi:MAG: translation initiation factor IF-2 N-terminal domain-containing protein, partial [Terriglobales bacterium]